jgi:hypothetical protein
MLGLFGFGWVWAKKVLEYAYSQLIYCLKSYEKNSKLGAAGDQLFARFFSHRINAPTTGSFPHSSSAALP